MSLTIAGDCPGQRRSTHEVVVRFSELGDDPRDEARENSEAQGVVEEVGNDSDDVETRGPVEGFIAVVEFCARRRRVSIAEPK